MPDLTSGTPDMKGYYAKVAEMLDGLRPEEFTPNLRQLMR